MVTFVKATYVLVTFVHISNISAFYWSNFDQTLWTQFFLDHDFCGPKCSWAKLLRTQIFFEPKILFQTVSYGCLYMRVFDNKQGVHSVTLTGTLRHQFPRWSSVDGTILLGVNSLWAVLFLLVFGLIYTKNVNPQPQRVVTTHRGGLFSQKIPSKSVAFYFYST